MFGARTTWCTRRKIRSSLGAEDSAMSTDRLRGAIVRLREAGRWLATPLFLVVIVLETTDLVLAVDSDSSGVWRHARSFLGLHLKCLRDSSLRALYFLLAGILPYFQYLDEASPSCSCSSAPRCWRTRGYTFRREIFPRSRWQYLVMAMHSPSWQWNCENVKVCVFTRGRVSTVLPPTPRTIHVWRTRIGTRAQIALRIFRFGPHGP